MTGGLEQVYQGSIEIQIDETGKDFVAARDPQAIYGSSLHKTGAVYGLAPATRWASKAVSPRFAQGYWNTFEITANEDRISVLLNGEPVVREARLPANLVADRLHRSAMPHRRRSVPQHPNPRDRVVMV